MTLAVFHRSPGTHMLLSGTHIQRAAFAVLCDADQVLSHAQQAAQTLHDDTERLVQAQRDMAFQAGLAEGRTAGTLAVLGSLEVERRLRELLASRIADVVEQCLRSVLGDMGEATVFQRRVRQLLRNVNPAGGATLHVCPAQAHLAQAVIDEQGEAAGAPLRWLSVMSDDHCQPDALVLETRVGFVDSSIELTLAGAREIISAAVQRAASQLGL
jgi:type III secretion system HrpE/YscL family protein